MSPAENYQDRHGVELAALRRRFVAERWRVGILLARRGVLGWPRGVRP